MSGTCPPRAEGSRCRAPPGPRVGACFFDRGFVGFASMSSLYGPPPSHPIPRGDPVSRLLEDLQGRILARAARAGDGALDRELGSVVDRCRSWVSKARAGERTLDLEQLAHLIRRYGAVAVLEPLARLDGCTVVEVDNKPAADVVGQAVSTAQVSMAYVQLLRDACDDGVISKSEREALLGLQEQLIHSARQAVPGLGRTA